MKKHGTLYLILALVFGAFVIVFGGIDDSPGAQVFGLLVILISVVGMIKRRKMNH